LGQPDLLNIKWIADAGGVVFTNLPLIFAIGVAVGFAKENHGAAALAGGIGYLILTAVLKSINDKLDMGVLAGILCGIVAGNLYNRFKDIKMPEYLAFFGGKRFVPIITGLVCVVLGLLCGYIWPVVQTGIDWVGHALIGAGGLGLFIYGVLNRLLLVTGLHHILNSLVWFVFGSYPGPEGKAVTGDLHRFFAGDPTAGAFMTGFFPVMMFGLPAACLAMYHAATGKPEGGRRTVNVHGADCLSDRGDRARRIHLYVSRADPVRDSCNPDRHFYGFDDLFGREARIHILCRSLRLHHQLQARNERLDVDTSRVGLLPHLLLPIQLRDSKVQSGNARPR
jgi:hypothetical protein